MRYLHKLITFTADTSSIKVSLMYVNILLKHKNKVRTSIYIEVNFIMQCICAGMLNGCKALAYLISC